MKLTWTAVALACLASIVQSFVPLWVFITIIIVSLLISGTQLIIMQRKFAKAELIAQMDKAFGIPNDRKVR